jgi:hypothetical protein
VHLPFHRFLSVRAVLEARLEQEQERDQELALVQVPDGTRHRHLADRRVGLRLEVLSFAHPRHP